MPYVGLVSRVLDITPFVVIGTEKKEEDTGKQNKGVWKQKGS